MQNHKKGRKAGMADREKVIKGLESCKSSDCIGRGCPYFHDVIADAIKNCDCTTELVRDVIEVLKEQGRKTGHWVFGNTMGHSWMKCSNCLVSQSGQTACFSYCPNCGAEMGRSVKWDER